MKKYNLVKLVLLAVICAGGVLHTQLAKANYNSAFNKEAYYAKLENKDIAKTSDLLLDTHKSLFLGQTKAGKVRNISFLVYPKKQTERFSGYAHHWVNIRMLKTNKVYLYTDKTTHGNYLVQYYQLAKRQGKSVKMGAQKIHISYSQYGNITLTYKGKKLKVNLKSGQTTWESNKVMPQSQRQFKSRVPKVGTQKARLVKDAKRYLGVPYRYAGRDPFGGLDCATFVNQVYLDVTGKDIGGMTGVQERLGKHCRVSSAKVGDLLFWKIAGQKYTYHVAMVIGHGKLIEEAGDSVHISNIKARQPQFAIHMKN